MSESLNKHHMEGADRVTFSSDNFRCSGRVSNKIITAAIAALQIYSLFKLLKRLNCLFYRITVIFSV